MIEDEYNLMSNQWDGPMGAAYVAAYEYCSEKGYIKHL